MKTFLFWVVVLVVSAFVVLILLGIWADANTRNGVPVQTKNEATATPTPAGPDYGVTIAALQTQAAEKVVEPAQATIAALQTQIAGGGQQPPTASTPTPAGPVAQATTEAPGGPPPAGCKADSPDGALIDGLTEITAGTDYLHVQFWRPGQPERETILQPGKTYLLNLNGGGGKVWRYTQADCTFDQVRQQATQSLLRRGNTGGWVDFEDSGITVKN